MGWNDNWGWQWRAVMSASEVAPVKSGNGGNVARRANPFSVLQSEIDRVFDNFIPWRGSFEPMAFTPSMEVTETDKSIEITTELPGLDDKDIDISIANDILTIRGEKRAEKEEKKRNYRLVERSYGAFERSLALPPGIRAEAIKASMNKGVLKLVLPKPAAAQAQKVKITPQE
jgi:HSP20 family protein